MELVQAKVFPHRREVLEPGRWVSGAGSVRDAGHHLERSDGGGCVDHGGFVGRSDQLVPHVDEIVGRRGRSIDESGQQIGVGYGALSPFVGPVVAAVGDERQIDVGIGRIPARTEQASVCDRSIEAFPQRRQT